QCGARLRRRRDGARRSSVLLRGARRPFALSSRESLFRRPMMSEIVNLLGLDADGLAQRCADWGQTPFRARQPMRWIHQRGEHDLHAMTDLARDFREVLERSACVAAPAVIADNVSADGTRKWLLDVGAGNAVETVYIPEADRGTLCISTQAGCAVNCLFCSTGKQGFSRN